MFEIANPSPLNSPVFQIHYLISVIENGRFRVPKTLTALLPTAVEQFVSGLLDEYTRRHDAGELFPCSVPAWETSGQSKNTTLRKNLFARLYYT